MPASGDSNAATGEGEEHQPGGAVAPGQLLDPDRHGEEEGSVAEEREALPMM